MLSFFAFIPYIENNRYANPKIYPGIKPYIYKLGSSKIALKITPVTAPEAPTARYE
jgi:hypothetical protein